MLRGIDEYDGAGVYIRKLVDALLELDRVNQYVLFYDRDSQLGRYAGRPNVREVVVRAPGKLLWDQVAVPLAARRARVDVLFHHKFSIPVVAPCPTVVQQRGTEYWTFPEYYQTLGRPSQPRLQQVEHPALLPACRSSADQLGQPRLGARGARRGACGQDDHGLRRRRRAICQDHRPGRALARATPVPPP